MKVQKKVTTISIAAGTAVALCLTGCLSSDEEFRTERGYWSTGEESTVTDTEPTPTPDPVPAPSAGGMVKLYLDDFPKPMFICSWPVKPLPLDLEKPGKPRTHLIVPPDLVDKITNVAKGKTVSSSGPAPTIGALDYITDGDKSGGDGYLVELGSEKQWIQIDLGKPYPLYAVAVWHYHKQTIVYFDVIIEISDDPEFVTSTLIYNNDHDNSYGKGFGEDKAYLDTNHGRIVDLPGTKARYVRLHSNGNTRDDLNHYIEVAAFSVE